MIPFMFAVRFAFKSIARRPKKNLGTILAVALGVTLLIGVQVGSVALEQTLADNWYRTIGANDLAVYDLSSPLFAANVTQLIEDADLAGLTLITERLDLPSVFYFEKDGQLVKGVDLQGLVPEHQDQLGGFYDTSGNKLDASMLESNNSIFINNYLAEQKGVSVGDTVLTSMPDGLGGSTALELEVVGIIDVERGRGHEDFFGSQNIAYTNIETLRAGLAEPLRDAVSRIYMQFSGVDRSTEALVIDGGLFPGKDIIENALEDLEQYFKDNGHNYRVFSGRIQVAENVQANISGITSVLTLFVIILNLVGLLLIINVQAMGLDDRRYQTAVLRAMGSNKQQIFSVFLIESTLVGIVGALVGVGIGVAYGSFIVGTIAEIFGLVNGGLSNVFTPQLLTTAVAFGIFLAVSTAVVPAWFAASRSITNELRGIEQDKVSDKRSIKPLIVGLATLITGLMSASNIGEFWTDDAWTTFEDTTNILLALGFSIFGLGLLLSYANKRMGYNIAGLAIYGLALYALFDRLELITAGEGNNWLTIVMLYLVLGVVMLVIVNFDYIMKALDKVLSINPGTRAISQVSTRAMIAKKGRLAMVFTVLTLVLVLNVFIAVSAHSITESNVASYEIRSQGVDVVINAEVPNAAIEDVVEQLDGVQEVYAFRSYMGPLFVVNPTDYATDDEAGQFLRFRRIVEVDQNVINPSGTFEGEDDLLFHTFRVNEIEVGDTAYDHELNLPQEEKDALSQSLLEDFFANEPVNFEAEILDSSYDTVDSYPETGAMVLGDFFSDLYNQIYFQAVDFETGETSVIPAYQVGAMFSMFGDWEMLSGAMMVTPELFEQLPGSAYISEPNLFLVKSSLGYFDAEGARELAISIEQALNDLNDDRSLSAQQGILLGATTRIVHDEVSAFWEVEAAFWDFLNIFSALGLIIGAMGMVIIAVRSVAERTREIGMMRAIGFQRKSVVFTVALELIFVSAVGLIAGVINGALMTQAFLSLMLEVPPAYPAKLLVTYVGGLVAMALLAGLLPGIRASRVPPSEALRYTG